jgi:hypothetical protein
MDNKRIGRWFDLSSCSYHDALIGVPTGVRFDVLDIDTAIPGAPRA